MKFHISHTILLVLLAVVGVLGAPSGAIPSSVAAGNYGDDGCNPLAQTRNWKYEMLGRYLIFWSSYSFGNVTKREQMDYFASDDITVVADRVSTNAPPPAPGSVPTELHGKDALLAWSQQARQGWDKYWFKTTQIITEGIFIVTRWEADFILGDYPHPTTLKKGDPFTYNGTSILTLNPCTGLIDYSHIAQDYISYYHNLGLTNITV